MRTSTDHVCISSRWQVAPVSLRVHAVRMATEHPNVHGIAPSPVPCVSWLFHRAWPLSSRATKMGIVVDLRCVATRRDDEVVVLPTIIKHCVVFDATVMDFKRGCISYGLAAPPPFALQLLCRCLCQGRVVVYGDLHNGVRHSCCKLVRAGAILYVFLSRIEYPPRLGTVFRLNDMFGFCSNRNVAVCRNCR